jgi:hypothetical protein
MMNWATLPKYRPGPAEPAGRLKRVPVFGTLAPLIMNFHAAAKIEARNPSSSTDRTACPRIYPGTIASGVLKQVLESY